MSPPALFGIILVGKTEKTDNIVSKYNLTSYLLNCCIKINITFAMTLMRKCVLYLINLKNKNQYRHMFCFHNLNNMLILTVF